VNDPRSLSDQDLDIAAMPEAPGNIDFDHTGANLADRVCAPSNGFWAAVYDQHRPRHWCSRAVNSGTRWLPESVNLRLKVEAGNPPSGPQLATNRNPSVGVP
jgi:hypothetical protein